LKKPVCQQYGCQNKYHLKGCRYCHRAFCPEHRNAFPPSGAFEGKWPPEGHPCPDYIEVHERLREKQAETERTALDRLLSLPQKAFAPQPRPIPWEPTPPHEPRPFKPVEEKKFPWKTILGVLFVAVLIWFFATHPLSTGSSIVLLSSQPCADETSSGSCSQTKPFYCDNGAFVKKPEVCGCQEGYRSYQGDCIKRIECSDETLAPECSANKPFQCTMIGTLKKNSTACGCPEGYKVKEGDCKLIQKCNDGTEYDECSTFKPYYCDNGNLQRKASTCGCPNNQTYVIRGDACEHLVLQDLSIELVNMRDAGIVTTETESRSGINYVNTLRAQYGKNPISFDIRAYNLGLARTRDMFENHYMDHTSPSGECPDNMKLDFGFSANEFLAENAAGTTRSYSNSYYDYVEEKVEVRETIDGWIDSRGHRYNLLYDYHKAGAVVCYGGSCVFLGVNNDLFGSGCHTAAEGIAFWNTAPSQEGEK